MRTLVIDDDIVVREQLKALLNKCGDFEVECAPRGKIGIDMFCASVEDAEPYRLVMVDIQMPDVSGHEVVKAIRECEEKHNIVDYLQTKILMATVSHDFHDCSEAYYNFCNDYVVKPITFEKLYEKLGNLFNDH